jgi:hypothetical protein
MLHAHAVSVLPATVDSLLYAHRFLLDGGYDIPAAKKKFLLKIEHFTMVKEEHNDEADTRIVDCDVD